jgi:hypothetical protein
MGWLGATAHRVCDMALVDFHGANDGPCEGHLKATCERVISLPDLVMRMCEDKRWPSIRLRRKFGRNSAPTVGVA